MWMRVDATRGYSGGPFYYLYNPPMRRATDIGWVLALFFGSGLCSLIDEVVWVRLLKLTFGNTVYASSVVVSVFLGGLALGAMLMGRHADRLRDRLGWYAALEAVAQPI